MPRRNQQPNSVVPPRLNDPLSIILRKIYSTIKGDPTPRRSATTKIPRVPQTPRVNPVQALVTEISPKLTAVHESLVIANTHLDQIKSDSSSLHKMLSDSEFWHRMLKSAMTSLNFNMNSFSKNAPGLTNILKVFANPVMFIKNQVDLVKNLTVLPQFVKDFEAFMEYTKSKDNDLRTERQEEKREENKGLPPRDARGRFIKVDAKSAPAEKQSSLGFLGSIASIFAFGSPFLGAVTRFLSGSLLGAVSGLSQSLVKAVSTFLPSLGAMIVNGIVTSPIMAGLGTAIAGAFTAAMFYEMGRGIGDKWSGTKQEREDFIKAGQNLSGMVKEDKERLARLTAIPEDQRTEKQKMEIANLESTSANQQQKKIESQQAFIGKTFASSHLIQLSNIVVDVANRGIDAINLGSAAFAQVNPYIPHIRRPYDALMEDLETKKQNIGKAAMEAQNIKDGKLNPIVNYNSNLYYKVPDGNGLESLQMTRKPVTVGGSSLDMDSNKTSVYNIFHELNTQVQDAKRHSAPVIINNTTNAVSAGGNASSKPSLIAPLLESTNSQFSFFVAQQKNGIPWSPAQ